MVYIIYIDYLQVSFAMIVFWDINNSPVIGLVLFDKYVDIFCIQFSKLTVVSELDLSFN